MPAIELPPSIEPLFVAAGWRPGRHVDVPLREFGGFPIFPAAENLLAQFAHLHVGTTGRGSVNSRGDVRFDPVKIGEDADSIAPFQARLDTRVFPLGSAHREYESLFIDERGCIYSIDMPGGEFWLIDSSFTSAMEKFLLGLRRGCGEHARGLTQIHPHPRVQPMEGTSRHFDIG